MSICKAHSSTYHSTFRNLIFHSVFHFQWPTKCVYRWTALKRCVIDEKAQVQSTKEPARYYSYGSYFLLDTSLTQCSYITDLPYVTAFWQLPVHCLLLFFFDRSNPIWKRQFEFEQSKIAIEPIFQRVAVNKECLYNIVSWIVYRMENFWLFLFSKLGLSHMLIWVISLI